MNTHPCSEKRLVEQPAIGLFAALSKFNPVLPPPAIAAGINELTRNLLLPRLQPEKMEVS